MKARKNPFLHAAATTAMTVALCFLPGSLLGDNTWDGGGADANWTTNANWGFDTAPSFGTLTFSGSARTTNVINASYNMNGLNYTGASAWTLNSSGGSILSLFDNGGVQAKIENNTSGALVTINAPVLFAATTGTARGEINAISGNLTFGSAATIGITGSGVAGLEFFGNGNTATMGGIISGTSKYLAIRGTGAGTAGNTVILNAANSYTGDTQIDTGTLVGGNSSAFGTTGTVYVGNGSNAFGNTSASVLLATGGVNISRNIVTNKADNGGSAGTGTRTIGGSNTAGTTTYSGNVFLNGGAVLSTASGGTTTFSGIIQNGTDTGVVSRAVNVNGAGTVILSGANTFTGGFTLSSGAVRAAATSTATGGNVTAGAFGAGPITINGGTIFSTGVDIAANNISIGGDFAINSGTNALNGRVGLSGAINLGNAIRTVTLGRSGTFAGTGVSGFESLRFNAVANGPAASVSSGTLRLVGDSSTNGTTSVVGASFQTATNFTNNAGLTIGSNVVMRIGGTSPGTGTNAATLTVESGGYFNLSDGNTVSRNLTTAGLNGAGNITNLSTVLGTGSLTVGDNNTTGSFSGTIADGSTFNATTGITALGLVSLTKTGTGTQTLSGANNYSGATSVSAGVLNIQHATALGNTTGSTSVTSGAALQIQGGITVGAEALSLNGTGISADGSLRNISGNNLWQGTVTLGAASRINSDAGSLTFNTAANSITGNNLGLTFGGAGDTTVGGTITTGTGTITKDGAGTLALNGANTYTGLTTVSVGTLRLGNVAALGTTAAGSTVTSGAVLDLNGQTVGAEALSLNGTGIGGGGALINSGSAASLSGLTTISTGTSIGGSGNFTLSGGIAATASSNNLIKVGAGTVTLSAAAGTNRSASATTQIDSGVLRISNASALATSTSAVTTINGGTLELTGAITLDQPITLNNGGTVRSDGTNASNGKITVSSAVAANSVTLSTVSAGDVFTAGNGSNDITGGNGADDTINIAGPGTVVLAQASDYVGNWSFNAGTTQIGSATALGATAASTITLNGGALNGRLAGSTTFTANPITVTANSSLNADRSSNGAGVNYTFGTLSIGANTLNTTSTAAVTSGTGGVIVGATTLTGNATFNVTNGATAATTLTLGGIVTGSGFGITKSGSGALSLLGVNTYTGGTVVNSGTLNVGGTATNSGSTITGSATGTGSVTFANGTTLSNSNSTTWFAPTITLNGTLNLVGGQRLAVAYNTLELGSASRVVNVNSRSLSVTGGNTLASENTGLWSWETATTLGTPVIQNGTLDLETTAFTGTTYGTFFIRGTNFTNADLMIGNNVILGANGPAALGGALATSPNVTINSNGILNMLSTGKNVRSLAGGGSIFNSMVATNTNASTLNIIGTSGSTDFSGVISNGPGTGALSLNKTGASTQILSGTNTYTGATEVMGGKLVVNGNISTSSLTTVAVGATLGGGGTLGKTIVNGTLAVGNSPGTMTFIDTLGLNGTTIMEIDGTAGAGVMGGHDFANLTGGGAAGVLTYGGSMTLDMGVIFGTGNYSWNLFDMVSETGTFTTIALTDQYSGSLLDGDLNGVWDLTSGDNTWQFTESTGVLGLTVIPEPRAALLGGLGLLALLRRRRSS